MLPRISNIMFWTNSKNPIISILILTIAILSNGCSKNSTQDKLPQKNQLKTSISKEISSSRVKIKGNVVFLDKIAVGRVKKVESRSYPELLKTSLEGLHSFLVTELANSDLLITGGVEPEFENHAPTVSKKTFYWHSDTNELSPGLDMSCPRVGHNVYELRNKNLLISGGDSLVAKNTHVKRVDLFDQETKSVLHNGTFKIGRRNHSVLQIGPRRVVVVGGLSHLNDTSVKATDSIEIYNFESGSSSIYGKLCYPRENATVILTEDKGILVLGGFNSESKIFPAELIELKESIFE